MATPRLTPSERDGALARLRTWRTAIAVAGFQQPTGGLGRGFGRGQAVTGGS